ncbi:MAG: phosphatidate cytidylyltransferase, partial [Treponema sp.]|nr:phosphatidate cytidylyltransferase [Treponema sp.]
GPVTLVLGIILAALLWKEAAAAAGIFALAFGDGLASLSGKLLGQTKVPLTRGKTAAGSLTCFLAIFITSFLVSKNAGVALCLAGTGMFMELLPLKDFDNVIIPVAIGGMYTLLI